MEIYRLHANVTAALREVGTQISVTASLFDEGEDASQIESLAISELYIRGRVENICGAEYLDRSPLTGGRRELQYYLSSVLKEDDVVDLIATYRVSPLTGIVPFAPKYLFCRYYGRAWTGYDVNAGNKEEQTGEFVYVTNSGEVYHENRSCSHLKRTVMFCAREKIGEFRNESGEIYRACEKCHEGKSETVYFTVYGNRYHESRECSDLKRPVRVMPKSEARKHYRACKDCGASP